MQIGIINEALKKEMRLFAKKVNEGKSLNRPSRSLMYVIIIFVFHVIVLEKSLSFNCLIVEKCNRLYSTTISPLQMLECILKN